MSLWFFRAASPARSCFGSALAGPAWLAVCEAVIWACAVAVALGGPTPARAAEADVWRLDPEHAEVRFSWDHLGLSRQSGEIVELYGRLKFNPTNPADAAVDVTLLLKGLRTGVTALDQLLVGPDYFDAERFPRITFKSRAIRQTGQRTGEIEGDLTIRDVSRSVTLQARWNFTGEHPLAPYNPVYRGRWVSGFTASARILRSAFGITTALPLVSDAIDLEINAEFIRVE